MGDADLNRSRGTGGLRSGEGVLVAVDHFLPGFKAGGPIRAIAGLVAALGDEISFRVLTKDRDLGDGEAFDGVTVDRWSRVGRGEVFYASPRSLSLLGLVRILRHERARTLYLNSIFSPISARVFVLRAMRLIPNIPLIIAPRGEFSAGAIRIKPLRKRVYLFALRMLGALDKATWHASSDLEAADIAREWHRNGLQHVANVVVAPELSVSENSPDHQATARVAKSVGHARIAFISRVSRKKNLDGALRVLANVTASVTFDIFGPAHEEGYWTYCQSLIAALPPNILVRYRGSIPHDAVFGTLTQYDLFFLPTLGENFGHAIVEALAAGCPVLVSDQTPWRNLAQAKAGWDIALNAPEEFSKAIESVAAMNEMEHASVSSGAKAYAAQVTTSPEIIQANRKLFRAPTRVDD